MYNIKVYIGNYDRSEFYSIMGKFFAERLYKKILPYLVNDKNKIWYLFYKNNELAGFCGINICDRYTNFTDVYVMEQYKKSNLLKFMCEHIFKIYRLENIKVLTKNKNEINIWLNMGFKKTGERGQFYNLLWENKLKKEEKNEQN